MVTPPAIEPPRIAAPPAAISTATPTPRASPARTTADEAELPTSDEAPPISAAVSGEATDASSRVDHPAATSAGPGEDQPGEQSGTNWLWLLGGLLVIAGLAAAAAMAWRRKHARGPARPAEIERPRLAPPSAATSPSPGPTPPEPTPIQAPEPLQVSLEPLRMSLTPMNGALADRLQVANRGSAALTGLSIGADMIAAHASMTREQHLAGPSSGAVTQRIDRLEPGESRVIEGEFRVPFSQIIPIRKGNAALLLPLARFRVEVEGTRAMIRTFAVGQPGNGALQPFRLDQGPRIYPNLAQRAFA